MEQVKVAIGVIVQNGRVLVQRRHESQHQGGLWEFPGGKIEPDETPKQALIRELKEEVGLDVGSAEELGKFEFEYSERRIQFFVYQISAFAGEPESREGNAQVWYLIGELQQLAMPEANARIVKMLSGDD